MRLPLVFLCVVGVVCVVWLGIKVFSEIKEITNFTNFTNFANFPNFPNLTTPLIPAAQQQKNRGVIIVTPLIVNSSLLTLLI